ncbi:alpha-L-arabinofuranosidase [Chitinophaga sp. SYP-B3965]|uniref:alpha-L-arabinofuranosidase n=1 Tax=Chitinophaga sp. SYP-B3965 TaxID=2663120 RepID=UPI001299FEB9|nr:alpha-L-arabinofuranosidase [Chitinophaga sp. SYP-B3965]MRG48413.1 alpha-L-arabinofuranosidase [Chitinophaga sp. SYP-B3965]
MIKKASGVLLCTVLITMIACNKRTAEKYNGNSDTSGTVITVPDPALATTIGFFMEGWAQKEFTAPSYIEKEQPAEAAYTVTLDASTVATKISPALFGNNSNVYMTQMITETKLINHIRNLHPGIIRFPGGNLSSIYFWNAMPGNPPADAPLKISDADGKAIDAGYWYGGNTDGWTISVENYYKMLQQTGNEGIITINYAYARYSTATDPVAAAAHLAADWVRYDKGRTRYWEIGNESNGVWQAGYRIDVTQNKDGQPEFITGDLYGRHFKVFADSMRKAASESGKTIYIGAQLLEHEPATWATPTDKLWNAGVLQQAATSDFFIVHSYFTPFNTNSNPPEVLASAEAVTKAISDHLNLAVTNAHVNMKPVALTEWNIFATGSQQMVSQVAGMHAVLVMGEMMKYRFGMASRWDLANAWENGNDHGLFSQGEAASGEEKWAPRPAFYYLYFFQKLLGDRFINTEVSGTNGNINAYASTYSSGEVTVALVNRSTVARNVQLAFRNFKLGKRYYWYVLTGGEGVSSFSRKVFVNGQGPAGIAGGPDNYTSLKAFSASAQAGVKINLPPMSVVFAVVEKP